MIIKKGNGKTKYGKGIDIKLSGEEVALAIDSYLYSHGIYIEGAATIRVNDNFCKFGSVYVDPSGSIIFKGKKISGRTGRIESY